MYMYIDMDIDIDISLDEHLDINLDIDVIWIFADYFNIQSLERRCRVLSVQL